MPAVELLMLLLGTPLVSYAAHLLACRPPYANHDSVAHGHRLPSNSSSGRGVGVLASYSLVYGQLAAEVDQDKDKEGCE